jgi:hypothetical protein
MQTLLVKTSSNFDEAAIAPVGGSLEVLQSAVRTLQDSHGNATTRAGTYQGTGELQIGRRAC